MDQELIQDKIKRLLNLASTNTNEHEAAAALAGANKLAEKYRIEIATLEISGDNSAPVENAERDDNPFLQGGRIRMWKKCLIDAIVSSQGCSSYSKRIKLDHGRRDTVVIVFGRSSDLQIARNMFNWALSQLEFLGPICCVGKGKRYANGWYTGAVVAISAGLKKGKEKAREGVSTAALTVVDNRKNESDLVLRKAVPNLRTVYGPNVDADGYNAGNKVGSKMNIGKTALLS